MWDGRTIRNGKRKTVDDSLRRAHIYYRLGGGASKLWSRLSRRKTLLHVGNLGGVLPLIDPKSFPFASRFNLCNLCQSYWLSFSFVSEEKHLFDWCEYCTAIGDSLHGLWWHHRGGAQRSGVAFLRPWRWFFAILPPYLMEVVVFFVFFGSFFLFFSDDNFDGRRWGWREEIYV